MLYDVKIFLTLHSDICCREKFVRDKETGTKRDL